jgi:hypothetical protein
MFFGMSGPRAVLVKNLSRRGRHLYIWDCDATMNQDFQILQLQELILGTQLRLLELAKTLGRIDGIAFVSLEPDFTLNFHII